ncbi:hypothetical protein B0T20DRAFT_50045 [Sordaria brevicollis]|uniref:Uncharacterized protein n=1 Tax=Sordaria brevicollis TaxID=83679 RepID=A0AAE0P2L5_SORBR|nr:hypothetical protein B0T20DRAFT_50045 [Sordaria brevicollis]
MYRTNHPWWKLTHLLCILGNLGLIIAGVVAFIHNLQNEADYMDATSHQPTTIVMNLSNDQTVINSDAHSCNIVLQQGLGNGANGKGGVGHSSFGIIVNELLPVASVIVGTIGLILNIGIFAALLAVETTSAKVALTEGEQHWRKKIVTVSCCVFNLLLAGAGIGLAGAMGIRLSNVGGRQSGMSESERSLIAPLVLGSVQAPLCVITALFDFIKNHREGKDLID